ATLLLLAACAPKAPPAPAADATTGAPVPGAPTTGASTAAPRGKGFAAEAITGELVVSGPLKERVSTAPADLVVYYGGEHKGSLETCGCPKNPRGSFARFGAYVEASRAANPGVPSVVVNAGYWLQDAMGFDGAPRSDVILGNRWMVEGSRMLGWDALNVGYPDVAGLATLPADGGLPLPLVSANVTGPGVNRWVIVERDGLRIGITGITAVGQTLSPTAAYTIAPPDTAGPVLDALAQEADVVVLLAYQASDAAAALAASRSTVDVVVDAAMHRDFTESPYVGQAAWASSNFQTMRLGELRLDLDAGRVVGGRSRHVDLDALVPDDPKLATLTRKARAELDAEQKRLYGE
ncbi:MAG: hypothetical protein ACK4YP_28240, partial [Myxococcota bacterium]